MTPIFRLGIVGTGLIVQESHLPAALAIRGLNVTALVDPAPGRARTLADRFGISPQVLDSVKGLNGLVDGVIIATPNHTHAQIAIECMESGLHVLIEKPIAPSVTECEQIIEARNRTGVTAAAGYCLRFWPSVQVVKRLLAEGTLGIPRRFLMQFGSQGGWTPLSGYYLRRDSGGGVMAINGSHYLERALHWFGAPDEASMEDDADAGIEADATAALRFGEVHGAVRVSKTCKLPAGSAVETDRGILVHRDWGTPSVEFFPHGHDGPGLAVEAPECSVAGRPDPYRLQIEDFMDSCIQHRAPEVSLDDGVAVSVLLERLYQGRRRFNADWYGPHSSGKDLQ
jgi:predicted dehydrogenase